jgi:hypothetical protein
MWEMAHEWEMWVSVTEVALTKGSDAQARHVSLHYSFWKCDLSQAEPFSQTVALLAADL